MLKNKKVLMILIIFFILFSFSCTTFADSENFSSEIPENVLTTFKNNVDLTDKVYWVNYWSDSNSYDFWVVNKSDVEGVKFYSTHEGWRYNTGYDDFRQTLVFGKTLNNMTQYKYYISDNTFSCFNSNGSGESIKIDSLQGKLIFYSNYLDLYTDNTYTTLFFQVAPAQETVLAQSLEGVEMTETTLAEVLGLLPLVIGFLVLVIGLRKALSLLFQILRNS